MRSGKSAALRCSCSALPRRAACVTLCAWPCLASRRMAASVVVASGRRGAACRPPATRRSVPRSASSSGTRTQSASRRIGRRELAVLRRRRRGSKSAVTSSPGSVAERQPQRDLVEDPAVRRRIRKGARERAGCRERRRACGEGSERTRRSRRRRRLTGMLAPSRDEAPGVVDEQRLEPASVAASAVVEQDDAEVERRDGGRAVGGGEAGQQRLVDEGAVRPVLVAARCGPPRGPRRRRARVPVEQPLDVVEEDACRSRGRALARAPARASSREVEEACAAAGSGRAPASPSGRARRAAARTGPARAASRRAARQTAASSAVGVP